MNSYERFIKALKKQKPDTVPIWELIIDRPVIEKLHGNISYFDFVELEGLDGVTVYEDYDRKNMGNDFYIDDWKLIWKMEPNGCLFPYDGPIKSYKDFKEYDIPDPDLESKYDSLKEIVKRFKGERAIVFLAHETFEYSHYLFGGMDKVFVNYITDPDFVKEVLDSIWSYKSRVIENAIEIGADVICTGDDYASRIGPLISQEHFREFVLPYLKKAVDIAHKGGVYFIKHTDGKIWKIIDDIISAGIDALDPLEPLAEMDIGEVKKRYGDKICMVGNIDCGMLLPMGEKEEVIEAVKETIAKAAPGGGHIIASSNSIHPAVDPENYKTMIEAARKYGRYPIDDKMIKEYRYKNYIRKFI